MQVIKNWKARRAGGRITINGQAVSGEPCKVVGVDVIEVEQITSGVNVIRATDRDGTRYVLQS